MDLMDLSISSFSVADNGVADNNLNGIENAGTPSKIQKCQKCACLLGWNRSHSSSNFELSALPSIHLCVWLLENAVIHLWLFDLKSLFLSSKGNSPRISIYFLCPFKSIFLYGIFLILIVVYCLTICIRFEGKIYISYNLIIYGPNGPLEFAYFL